jgi:hypothetical protein
MSCLGGDSTLQQAVQARFHTLVNIALGFDSSQKNDVLRNVTGSSVLLCCRFAAKTSLDSRFTCPAVNAALIPQG